ncbi:DUF3168 domain-containing protein [Sphingomonas sp. HITSZ_GF]|uniref:tail completion protein gp17 n=1 Tax=Sphingomonas sp. HITSZ_GF TaxID=3037247 RepID=UPI00240E4B45|nr:DUF3168 domain-containing protein [Sphingomonas sp. HITSZ_GF]MDG2532070.1 DUF3168 domain-containing protein [Sphingomonas sp. HITSZ_GF]
MIETLLANRLETVAANVYPDVAPMSYQTPCVVYQRIDTETINDLDGGSDQAFVTFQISISSPRILEAKILARNVRNSLRTWIDDDVEAVSWINEHSTVDNSTDVALHRVLLFFRFFCAE